MNKRRLAEISDEIDSFFSRPTGPSGHAPKIAFGATYTAMFQGGWDNCLLAGGRYTAKSWHATMFSILMSDQHGFDATCFRQYQNSIRDSKKRNIEKLIDQLGWQDRFKVGRETIEHRRTGTVFRFKGLHLNLGAIRSSETFDYVDVEEGQFITDEAWQELWPTIRGENAKFVCTMNPLTPDVPIDKKFRCEPAKRPARTLLIETTIRDNPTAYRSRRAIDAYFRMKHDDPELWEHVYGGAYRKGAAGSVFGDKVEIGVIPADKLQRYLPLYGLDHGSNDPTVCVRVYALLFERILYIEAEAYRAGVALEDLVELIDEVLLNPHRDVITADYSGKRENEFLRGKRRNIVDANKGAGSILAGIKWIRSFDKIVVHPRCVNTIRESKLYKWKKNNMGALFDVPQDAHNHSWDAIRYAVEDINTNLSNTAQEADETEDGEVELSHW